MAALQKGQTEIDTSIAALIALTGGVSDRVIDAMMEAADAGIPFIVFSGSAN